MTAKLARSLSTRIRRSVGIAAANLSRHAPELTNGVWCVECARAWPCAEAPVTGRPRHLCGVWLPFPAGLRQWLRLIQPRRWLARRLRPRREIAARPARVGNRPATSEPIPHPLSLRHPKAMSEVELREWHCPQSDCDRVAIAGDHRWDDRGPFQLLSVHTLLCPSGHLWTHETDGS